MKLRSLFLILLVCGTFLPFQVDGLCGSCNCHSTSCPAGTQLKTVKTLFHDLYGGFDVYPSRGAVSGQNFDDNLRDLIWLETQTNSFGEDSWFLSVETQLSTPGLSFTYLSDIPSPIVTLSDETRNLIQDACVCTPYGADLIPQEFMLETPPHFECAGGVEPIPVKVDINVVQESNGPLITTQVTTGDNGNVGFGTSANGATAFHLMGGVCPCCTSKPTARPTFGPTLTPTTSTPTSSPSKSPSTSPTSNPTSSPTKSPTKSPTTEEPTTSPTLEPTKSPTTPAPTETPTTSAPTESPNTGEPTTSPETSSPTTPTTNEPTISPTLSPTNEPTTSEPTSSPSIGPTTSMPTISPTNEPTTSPTLSPTQEPTTSKPTNSPSNTPTTSMPSSNPTLAPSTSPTTSKPTALPTTSNPTNNPTTSKPSVNPTTSKPTRSPNTGSPLFNRVVFYEFQNFTVEFDRPVQTQRFSSQEQNLLEHFQFFDVSLGLPLFQSIVEIHCHFNFEDDQTLHVWVEPELSVLGFTAQPNRYLISSVDESEFYNAEDIHLVYPMTDEIIISVDAPEVKSVSVDEQSAAVTIKFDRDVATSTQTGVPFSCNEKFRLVPPESQIDVFDSTTYAGSGTSENEFTCKIESIVEDFMTIQVQSGDGKTFPIPDDTELYFKQGNIVHELKSAGDVGVFEVVAESFGTIQQGNLDGIEFQMSYPSNADGCSQAIEVSVSQKSGNPNFSFKFFWTLYLVNNGEIELIRTQETIGQNFINWPAAAIRDELQARGKQESELRSKVSIRDTFFGIEVDHVVSNAIQFSTSIAQAAIPISFEKHAENSAVSFLSTEAQFLHVKIGTLNEGCSAGSLDGGASLGGYLYTFDWTITDQSQSEVYSSSGSPILSILSNLLVPGLYSVSVTVSSSYITSNLQPSTISLQLQVLESPLTGFLEGGRTRSIGSNKNLTLDGSRSCDPNAVGTVCDASLGYLAKANLNGLTNDRLRKLAAGLIPSRYTTAWTCESCTDNATNPLIVNNVATSESIIRFGGLQVSESPYVFRFTITDIQVPSRSIFLEQKVEVELSIVDCDNAEVNILPIEAKLNVGSQLNIFADVSDADSVMWSGNFPSDPSFDAVDLSRPKLFIPSNMLEGGIEYVFRLTATVTCPGNVGTVSSFSEIKFTTNRPPAHGVLSVSPLVGVAAIDEFTLTTTGWVDPEANLPLEYSFEYIFVEIGSEQQEYARGKTKKLISDGVAYSSKSALKTILPLNDREGTRLVLIAIARDYLKAESRRFESTTFSGVNVTTPVADAGGGLSPAVLQSLNITKQIEKLILAGQTERIPFLCTALTSALNTIVDSTFKQDNQALLQEIREICFQATVQTLDTLESAQVSSIDTLDQIAGSMETITKDSNQISEAVQESMVDQAQKIINSAKNIIDSQKRGENDPTAGNLIPESFRQNFANMLSNLLNVATGTNAGRRVLQSNASRCDLFARTRDNLEALARLENSVVVPGAPAKEVETSNIVLLARRESFGNIIGSLGNINVPGTNNQLRFPPGVLASKFSTQDGRDIPEELNVVLVKWNIDLRCEREEPPERGNCSDVYSYDGPTRDGINSIVSLDFLGFGFDADLRLSLNGLDETAPIIIELDLPTATELDGQCDAQFENIVCGAYNETSGDWSTDGCEFKGISSGGRVICECVHATDFSAWTSFKNDFDFTTKSAIEKFSFLAIMIVGVFLPMLYMVAIIGWCWAYKKDSSDAQRVQKGAVGRMILLRIKNQREQRRFFANLKEAAFAHKPKRDNGISNIHNVMQDTIENGRMQEAKALRKKNESRWRWTRRLYLALRYEHSLLGLSRFDPHYSRVQRFSVFLAVIVANLFVAAIFFELKDADDVSVSFLIGVVFLAAVAVSIPVKVFVKLLFKTSANPIGSDGDIASNMFRLLSKMEENHTCGIPEDDNLIKSYQQLIIATARLKKAEAYDNTAAKERVSQAVLDRISAASATTFASNTNSKSGRDSSSSIKKSPKRRSSEFAIDVEAGEIDIDQVNERHIDVDEVYTTPKRRVSKFVMDVDGENLVSLDLDDYEDEKSQMKSDEFGLGDVETARKQLKRAQAEVKRATTAARAAWKSVPTKEAIARMQNVRSQASAIMKFAAVVADEPSATSKARKSLLSYHFAFLGWVLVFAFYIGSTYYIVRFAALREAYAKDRGVQTESYYIVYWLGTAALGVMVSYVVAEPIIALTRYVLLPFYVEKCGSKNAYKDDDDEDENDDYAKMENAVANDLRLSLESTNPKHSSNEGNDSKTKKTIRDDDTHFVFDILADLVEALF